MLQDIFRIAIRNIANDKPVNIYLFCMDNEFIQRISAEMPGSQIEEWYPEGVLGKESEKYIQFQIIS